MTPELRTAAEILCHYAGAAHLVGDVRGSLIVWRSAFPHYDYWLLTDNGGEVNVERVNCPETMQSVSLMWFGMPLDAATIAYRIACVMREDPIDYDLRLGDDETAFLLSLRAA